MGQDVVVGQGQFGEAAYLQIAVKVVLYLRELQHDLGAFLLRLIQQWGDLQIIRQVGAIHIQQLTILIERQCRNLDGRPSPGAALLAPLDQNRTGRAGGYHFGVRLHIVDCLQPFVPILRVLNFVKKVVDILIRIDVFVIALQNIVHGAQLQHRMIHGDKDNLLGRNTALKQGLDHLVLYGGLSHSSCAGQNHCAPDVRLV